MEQISSTPSTTKYSERISNAKIVFFSFSTIISGFLFAMWGQAQFFATHLLSIPITLIPLIFLIYSLVDAINDPIIGYLTDRSKRFTARWGKRFPWIMIGVIISPILLILCFIKVSDDLFIAMLWLTALMITYESFMTLYEINHSALYPDLIREDYQRRKQTGFGGILGSITSISTAIIIPLIIGISGGKYTLAGYLGAVIFVSITVYVLVLFYRMGIKESEEMKNFRVELDEKRKSTSPVLEIVTRIFKDRNWMAIVIANSCWAIAGACYLYGLNYYVVDGLGLDIGDTILPLLLASLVSLFCAPIWAYLTKITGVKKAYVAGLIINLIGYLSFFFVTDIVGVILVFIFVGIGISATSGVVFALIFAEAIDNAALQSGKREEGSYNGILRVFSAFSYFIQTSIFAVVAMITGYVADDPVTHTQFAKDGLKLQMSLIPFMFLIIGIVIFVLLYRISKEDARRNERKLMEMGL
ncbi:MAG: MFS transporter [Candidatus Hodarchaeales archaeon]|jgi:GPH family glycoside/pentoside/hexuronide:cation symporter